MLFTVDLLAESWN